MRFEDLKVGMRVKANQLSNGEYSITKEANGCVGIVESIGSSCFTLKTTEHKDSFNIGTTFCGLEAEYFDKVEDVSKIKIELKEQKVGTAEVGDMVVTSEGDVILIIREDIGEYRGIVVTQQKSTRWRSSLTRLMELIEQNHGKIERVIKAENLKVVEI